MAWLPSITDDQKGDWLERADRRIRFLERFSERWQPEAGAAPATATNDIRMASANALTQAAELALASDQSQRGQSLMKRALGYLVEGPEDNWPIVRTALLGSLLSQASTSLGPLGVTLKDADRMRITSWSGPAKTWERAAGPLITSAVAYGSPENAFLLLLGQVPGAKPPANRLAFLVFANALEADTLPAFGFRRRGDGGLEGPFWDGPDHRQMPFAVAALLALHQRYTGLLRLLVSDTVHWQGELRLRAPLIDWTLLALHVALFRRNSGLVQKQLAEVSSGTPSSEVFMFLMNVARELA